MPRSSLPSRQMLDIWYARVGKARPFLRWAGGKQPFLYRFGDRLPEFTGTYIEPFLGSGAVFFHLARKRNGPLAARLGDKNKSLIRAFLAVRDDPDAVYRELSSLQQAYSAAEDKASFYYSVRDHANASGAGIDPATFIFLNRTCWNGLFRVNGEGKFNVPYGAPKTDYVIPTQDDLLNASAALKSTELRATDWRFTLGVAKAGDFAFIDPPYYSDVLREDAKYGRHQRQFGLRDHELLARELSRLAARKVDFVLTNSAEEEMVSLYKDHGLQIQTTRMPRSINSKADRRGGVPEIIVTPPHHSQEQLNEDEVEALLEAASGRSSE